MSKAKIEHINVTVVDPLVTAQLLVELFDWQIRWQGEAIDGGFTVHVGAEDSYLALYSRGQGADLSTDTYNRPMGLNHVGIVVDDLRETEKRISAAGYKTHSHADYEPGERFYFEDKHGLEFEVVSY